MERSKPLSRKKKAAACCANSIAQNITNVKGESRLAQIIEFGAAPDIDAMDAAALRDYLAEIRERIARLDEDEPEDMASEAYDEWSEQHEKLEDIADDILDRLEEQ